MLLKGRPLYDNKADASLFITPSQWNPLIEGIDRELNILLMGPRGSGKTSLLRQVQYLMREQGEAPAFVDATATPDVTEVAARIRNTLTGEPSPMVASAETAADLFRATEGGAGGASRALANLLRSIGSADPALILLDASGSAKAIYDLFGRFRDVVWQQPHRWVVAIDDSDRSTVMKPPADAFFDLVIEFEKWSVTDLAELLTRRYLPDETPDAVLVNNAAANANGSPREALRGLSHGVVNREDPSAFLNERGVLLDRASDMGRPHAMLLAELLDRGQASPSDEDLQQSLGVTRTRLTQLFHALQDKELVIAENERSNGPGRPRTVYRPALSR